jgi:hypothetical protein
MALAFYGVGWSMAPVQGASTGHDRRDDAPPATAADAALNAAQAARYAADPFARFDDQRAV